jgi:threonylcarbamoyladenosine tRNA methylthiotransferase CDKAL1
MYGSVFVKNFGCSSNTADGEVLIGCLSEAGFKITASETEADLIIYNTCAVKGPTENRIINEIKNAPKGKKIIVAGCLPKISFERLERETYFNGVVGPAFGAKIVEVATRVLAGETVVNIEDSDKPLLSLPKKPSNPVRSIVPINFGCSGSCSYCCVVQARGHLRSYRIQEIIERVQKDLTEGVKELWLTSQDTASYGRDLNTDLAELLLALDCIKDNFKIRVGMMTPNLALKMQSKLIRAFESNKVFKFLHLPMQSGDDTVLRNMHRFYTSAEFKGIVKAFRTSYPNLTIATDVILGFPGETGEAFQNTLKVLEEVKPDVVNVSKFFARPKTAAWKMKDGLVEKEETKHRSTLTSELSKQLSAERNRQWLKWVGEVLIDEKGKVEGTWIARNFAYKPIVIKSTRNLLGKTLQVEVVEAFGTYLKGEIA